MMAVVWFQKLLFGVGTVLAWLYRLVPNYGLCIILLTLVVRVVLLPLGIKQIRSMASMQQIQPKVKAIQQKYKGNRQKITEETQALYKELGVNPLGGCLPLLLQLPVLIALFAVLRGGGLTHIPQDSRLHRDIVAQHTTFVGANMLCSAGEAGRTVPINYKGVPPSQQIKGGQLKCGHGGPVRIPYYVFIAGMVATTYYQQRQMQRASPGVVNQQQQTMARVMPIMFGALGFIYQSGLVVYWTTANLFQIGQQLVMLPRMSQGAEETQKGQGGGSQKAEGPARPRPKSGPRPNTGRPAAPRRRPEARGDGSGGQRGGRGVPGRGAKGKSEEPDVRRGSREGSGRPAEPSGSSGTKSTAGGRNAGDRKKRRKR
jgi:YidC/Oxa1 family membrane protein insertase